MTSSITAGEFVAVTLAGEVLVKVNTMFKV